MTKISVTKEFSWDMAHMLSGHEGLCKNLHGHTYKMQVEVSSKAEKLLTNDKSSIGMIIDFKELKRIIKENIIDSLDHSFVYWSQSDDIVEHQIANVLRENGRRIVEVQYRPTAEEMALDFYKILSPQLSKLNLNLESIKLWETPTSFAEVRGE